MFCLEPSHSFYLPKPPNCFTLVPSWLAQVSGPIMKEDEFDLGQIFRDFDSSSALLFTGTVLAALSGKAALLSSWREWNSLPYCLESGQPIMATKHCCLVYRKTVAHKDRTLLLPCCQEELCSLNPFAPWWQSVRHRKSLPFTLRWRSVRHRKKVYFKNS